MSSKPRVRFAFRIIDGPNAGLGSTGWRVWTHGSDTYMTTTTTGSSWKLSLHGDVAWRYALTSENAASSHPFLPAGADRAPWKFEPVPFTNGERRAFVIAVTRAALRPTTPEARDVIVPVEDRWDRIATLGIWMTEAGHEPKPSRLPLCDPLPLDNGWRVWLVAGSERCTPATPEPVPDDAMIEPVSPATHDVRGPGLVVRGVRLG